MLAMPSITIPSSVTTIGGYAFEYCTALAEITNLNLNPVDIADLWVFRGLDIAGCTLTVPTSAVSAYQNAEVWKEYKIVGGGILVYPKPNDSEYGYTIGNDLYEGRATATVTATARSGYKFVNWTKEGVEVSRNNPYNFTVTEDVELIANFEEGETAIEDSAVEAHVIAVYPNPTTNKFIIDIEEPAIVKLHDLLGKEILIQTINDKTEINIAHLPCGIYNISVISGGKMMGNSKIVKR